jgi:hypothetical protein
VTDNTDEVDVGRDETGLERWDRNLVELVKEVRVAQTGVQVLLGFLLAVAFTPRFRSVSEFQRIDYFGHDVRDAGGPSR